MKGWMQVLALITWALAVLATFLSFGLLMP